MQLIAALDIGTTNVKAMTFDAQGRVQGAAERRLALDEPALGAAEQDPRAVVDASLEVLEEVLRDSAGVSGIALSSAMHSLVAVDEQGEPITALLTWADGRAAEQAERLRDEHPQLHTRTGTPLHAMAPLAKLIWWRENEPSTFRRAARWMGVKELLVHRLTGRWVTDLSCASGTGLLNLEARKWDGKALQLAEITEEQLCRLVPTNEVLELREGVGGAGSGTPLVVGAGDGPLANLGLGAVSPGVVACSVGTSGALRMTVERPSVDERRRLFCYALTEDRWVLGGAINNGGSVLDWAAGALAPAAGCGADEAGEPEERLLELAAEAPAGSDGLIMLPYLLSERAPQWNELARGAYAGLRHFHGRGHLVRAALEGVCQQLALVLDSIREAGHEVREVRATGGFSRSPLWRQILSDALDTPLHFARDPEGSALGAALLGLEALGMIDSLERAAELVQVQDVVEPNAEGAAILGKARPVFEELGRALMPTFRALEEIEGRGDRPPARQEPPS